MTQAQVADQAALSQPLISDLELGRGQSASIETWGMVAAAVGEQFVGYLEHAPGANLPRDIEHLKRQSALIQLAAGGGWVALPELAVDRDVARSRSVDVALVRAGSREAIVVEVWNWFDDVGAAMRGLDGKVAAVRTRLESTAAWQIRGLFIVRDTRRNLELIQQLRPLFVARFGANASLWLRALTVPDQAMPAVDGLLWSGGAGRA